MWFCPTLDFDSLPCSGSWNSSYCAVPDVNAVAKLPRDCYNSCHPSNDGSFAGCYSLGCWKPLGSATFRDLFWGKLWFGRQLGVGITPEMHGLLLGSYSFTSTNLFSADLDIGTSLASSDSLATRNRGDIKRCHSNDEDSGSQPNFWPTVTLKTQCSLSPLLFLWQSLGRRRPLAFKPSVCSEL